MYHLGVAKTLNELKVLPKIISGSSAGSIVATFICTKKQEDFNTWFEEGTINYSAFFQRAKTGSFQRRLNRLLSDGVLLDISVVRDFLRDNIGNITFQEAYDQTELVLNITVTGLSQYDQNLLLNYLTAPSVIIWSAVCCSCAIPFVYGPSILYAKDENGKVVEYLSGNRQFIDGSVGQDLPMKKLSELFNVNNFVVSQTNPYVIPFMEKTDFRNDTKNKRFMRLLKKLAFSEVAHRLSQLNQLNILPQVVQRLVNLALQEYEGHITILPIPTFKDYLNVLGYPDSHGVLMHFATEGARKVYGKIQIIKSYFLFEKTLDDSFKSLRSQIGQQLQHEIELIETESEKKVFRNQSFSLPRTTSQEFVKTFLQSNKYEDFKQRSESEKL